MRAICTAVKELMEYIYHEKPVLFLVLFFLLLCRVAFPFLLQVFASFVLYVLAGSFSFSEMLWMIMGYAALLAILSAIYASLSMIQNPMMYQVKQKITLRLYEKSMHVPYVYLEDMEYREMLNQAQKNGIDNSAVGFERLLNDGMLCLSSLASFLLYMTVFSKAAWWLGILLFLLSIGSIVMMRSAQSYEHEHKKDAAHYDQTLQYYHHMIKLPASGKDIRLFHLQDHFSKKIEHLNKKRMYWTKQFENHYNKARIAGDILTLFRDGIVYGYFVFQLFQGISIPMFLFYVSSVSAFSTHIQDIVNYYNEVARAALGVCDYDRYMAIETKKEKKSDFPKGDITITFDHVFFRYPDAKKDTLADVCFTIHAKEKIGIVGHNGAGKTTLIKLLCGFYQPTAGRILINDLDLCTLDQDEILSHITTIFQDAAVMAYSISKNISCETKENTDHQRVWECLKQVGLEEKVANMPRKEETFLSSIIDEKGVMLSGGEQQKLLMARDCIILPIY